MLEVVDSKSLDVRENSCENSKFLRCNVSDFVGEKSFIGVEGW